MSGHNKWSQIKRKKATADKRRGEQFSQLAQEITAASREKGGDLNTNAALRAAVERARAANVPKENIERAIARGAQGGKGAHENVIYEAYGPGGAALLIEVRTDNKNRTVAELKHVLQENGGRLADAGSVRWMFKEGKVAAPAALDNAEGEAFAALRAALEERSDVERVLTNVQAL